MADVIGSLLNNACPDPTLENLLSSLLEVRACGGKLFLFSDQRVNIDLDRYQNSSCRISIPAPHRIAKGPAFYRTYQSAVFFFSTVANGT